MSEDLTKVFAIELHGGGTSTIIDNMNIGEFYFIEDIYSWCKCGKMILLDNQGIWEFLPFVGDEKIVLTYYSPLTKGGYAERTYEFDIFKVSEVGDVAEGTAGMRERITRYSVEIFFIEKEHFKLHNPAYSRTWMDEKYYNIIKEIFKTHVELASFVVDESAGEIIEYFSMSQRTPAQAISWLGERMRGDSSGQPGFMFYSSTQDSGKCYNIATLEKLLMDGPLLADAEGNPRGVYFIGGASNAYAMNNILNTTVSGIDKTSLDFLAKRTYLGYDIYRKYQIKREFEFKESADNFHMMGNYGVFNDAEVKSHLFRAKEVLTGEAGDKHMDVKCLMEHMYWGEWIKQYCLQQLVTIMVRGDVHRYCGGQIEINWLSGTEEDMFNKQMIGRYLVKSITHYFSAFTKPIYTQKMCLIKNGYFDTDAEMYVAAKPKMENNKDDSDISDVKGISTQPVVTTSEKKN